MRVYIREERREGGNATTRRRCIYLSARVTESDEVSERVGQKTRVYDFRTRTGSGGCCARVRINLRLLVKIRALSFHLCVRARARARGLVRPCPTCACQDRCARGTFMYMRCRRRRNGTPVDFPLRKREREEREKLYRGEGKMGNPPTILSLSRVLFILLREKEILKFSCRTISTLQLRCFGVTCVIFLRRARVLRQVGFCRFPNNTLSHFSYLNDRTDDGFISGSLSMLPLCKLVSCLVAFLGE